ncbi:MAG: DUF3880 domain-containing protein [Roseburia sp.]|nr:DUF3880 domain-containing protein [Roseburia sp.]
MRILLYEWEAYLQYDVKWICKEKSISFETFQWKFADKNTDEAFERWFLQNVEPARFDALLSINYWPMLSKMAQACDMKYIAWCYDNPLNVIDLERTLGNPANHVFFFDRVQTEEYIRAGFDTVYYLPLGVNSQRLRDLPVSDADVRKYGAQVSFVGSLYESRMQDLRALADEYTRGFLDAAMAVQQQIYGCYLLEELVTEEMVAQFNRYVQEKHPGTPFHLLREALLFAMASEITRKERLALLTLLGRRYDVRLYSFHSSEMLQGVRCFPPVDYVTEMPKVFACSDINLNPILRCIQSGIPLRALDVMGAGGFLLSAYQPELVEQFVNEEEMVVYESLEDAVAKAEFYIRHEELRREIAQNGRARVLRDYSLQSRLQRILEISIK